MSIEGQLQQRDTYSFIVNNKPQRSTYFLYSACITVYDLSHGYTFTRKPSKRRKYTDIPINANHTENTARKLDSTAHLPTIAARASPFTLKLELGLLRLHPNITTNENKNAARRSTFPPPFSITRFYYNKNAHFFKALIFKTVQI